jgi:hypothetical protein
VIRGDGVPAPIAPGSSVIVPRLPRSADRFVVGSTTVPETDVKQTKTVLGAMLLGTLALVATAAQAAVAPKIRGTPDTSVAIGESYAFQPQATDADGSRLRFIVRNQPSWTTFDTTTGRLRGTPRADDVGSYADVTIRVTDGTYWRTLPPFTIRVGTAPTETDTETESPSTTRKANYGHYFATRYEDTPADVAMLCGQSGVKGVIWRRTWNEVEPSPGVYDFSSFDQVLRAIAGSHNPLCQLWIFVEYKSFNASPVRNPCPAHLQARYSAPNADGHRAETCFMWEPVVKDAYVRMMKAAGTRYDANPRVEGFVLQESALGFNGEYSQDVSAGGTYTAARWRDALVDMVAQCGNAFSNSRCLVFLNFLKGGQQYLNDVSRAISAIPGNRGCMSGPDLLPDNRSLFDGKDAVYQVLVRHKGCRSNSAQNNSYGIRGFNMDQVFNFAVRGTFGEFEAGAPRASGVCVNSYLFWNHRVKVSWTGQSWLDALPVIAAYPYGRNWLEQCQGDSTAP